MLRVNRFAAAIDMIAAGTSAPMPMAANATPGEPVRELLVEQQRHDGVAVHGARLGAGQRLHPGRDGHVSRAARSGPSSRLYAGSADMFRLITLRFLLASTPVMLCG